MLQLPFYPLFVGGYCIIKCIADDHETAGKSNTGFIKVYGLNEGHAVPCETVQENAIRRYNSLWPSDAIWRQYRFK